MHLVISAVNIIEGGPLQILKDAAYSAYEEKIFSKITLLVNDEKRWDKQKFNVIGFPNAKNNYFYRLKAEWFDFYKLSKRIKPDYWLSLHDITPRIGNVPQSVYCHNPSPFYSPKLRDYIFDFKQSLFSLFYQSLYKLRIKRNRYVIVQQDWIRNEFSKRFKVKNIIVAIPNSEEVPSYADKTKIYDKELKFIYPAFPRIHKNFELICEAFKIINKEGIKNMKLYLTIDGSENQYSNFIFKKYSDVDNIEFLGLLTKSQTEKKLEESSCLVFPSVLETWGLPLTEGKSHKMPIFTVDKPYAYETVGDYDSVCFLPSNKPYEWAKKIINICTDKELFDSNLKRKINDPMCSNWHELWTTLIQDKNRI